jgi:ribonuclease HII
MGTAFAGGDLSAGVDEAGRGALAGPLYVAAVILPAGFRHPLLRDSKTLNPTQREEIALLIQEASVAYVIVEVPVEVIERLNVLRATLWGMAQAIERLPVRPALVHIDGPYAPPLSGYRIETHIKGDTLYPEIAAASILAKTARDARLRELHQHYPHYHWAQNKGYPTPQHKEAIRKHGPSPLHRPSFLRKLGF